jgi:hypothetical protein
MTYFNGDSITNAMLRIRGTPGNENYSLLIDEEMIIGKIYKTMEDTTTSVHNKEKTEESCIACKKRNKKEEREEEQNNGKNKSKKKTKNRTEAFHLFFQNIVPIIKEMWTDRCIDRTTPVLGGRIVAEYDSLSKKVTQLYTMRSMVLPEDEIKIFDETLEAKLEETNQQLKKWIHRWRPVIDHSMKRVKELAQANSKPNMATLHVKHTNKN